jgi:hypothetical protein
LERVLFAFESGSRFVFAWQGEVTFPFIETRAKFSREVLRFGHERLYSKSSTFSAMLSNSRYHDDRPAGLHMNHVDGSDDGRGELR